MADEMNEMDEMDEMDEEDDEELEISESLEKMILCAIDEARQKLDEVGEFTPFTVMLSGENLYFETHPGDDSDECRESAATAVQAAESSIESYAFCYDGYIELDDGEHDAIIVEAAEVDDEEPIVVCMRYEAPTSDDGVYEYAEGAEILQASATSLL